MYKKQIVVPEITIHVMEEMRQERKIKLVLNNSVLNINKYINTDISRFDLYNEKVLEEQLKG